MVDPEGFSAVLAISTSTYVAFSLANIWNPYGWIVVGTIVVVGAVGIYQTTKSSSNYTPDPYARPGQKKQGRELKNKARNNKNWNPRSKPKPPKKHTPGRDHRRYR